VAEITCFVTVKCQAKLVLKYLDNILSLLLLSLPPPLPTLSPPFHNIRLLFEIDGFHGQFNSQHLLGKILLSFDWKKLMKKKEP